MYMAFAESLLQQVARVELLHHWMKAYLLSVAMYIVFSLAIIVGDIYLFYNL